MQPVTAPPPPPTPHVICDVDGTRSEESECSDILVSGSWWQPSSVPRTTTQCTRTVQLPRVTLEEPNGFLLFDKNVYGTDEGPGQCVSISCSMRVFPKLVIEDAKLTVQRGVSSIALLVPFRLSLRVVGECTLRI